jgi:hypothetical protein
MWNRRITSLFSLLFVSGIALGTDRVVGPDGPYYSVYDAVNAANPGDRVIIQDNPDPQGNPIPYDEPTIDLVDGITIMSESHDPNSVVITPEIGNLLFNADGITGVTFVDVTLKLIGPSSSVSRALYAVGSDIDFFQVTIADFRAEEGGAAIRMSDSELEFTDCTFDNNDAGATNTAITLGGAIHCVQSHLLVSGTQFSHNDAMNGMGAQGWGGAIYAWNSKVDISGNTVFLENSAYFAGALLAEVCVLNLADTEFRGNNAQFDAGALCFGFWTVPQVPILYGHAITTSEVDFQSNSSGENGGAVYLISPWETDNSWRGGELKNNTAYRRGGGVYMQGSHILFEDVEFAGNSAQYGGGFYHDEYGSVGFDNCVFDRNSAAPASGSGSGGAVYLEGDGILTRCTFHGNESTGISGTGGAISSSGVLELEGCNFTENTNGAGYAVVGSGAGDLAMSHCNAFGNTAGDWMGDMLEFAPDQVGSNRSLDPSYVDAAGSDYRLRWNSPLLDAGTGPLEFDLTLPDIGWKPAVPTHQISGTYSQDLLPENYEIIDNCTITGSIPAGASLRVATGKSLVIKVAGSGSQYTIGDAEGPRTAIVGRPSSGASSASSISFMPGTSPSRMLKLEGVLFNYPAISGTSNGELRFNSSMASASLSVNLDGDLLQFMHYSNLDQDNILRDTYLSFWKCKGTVSNLDFGDVNPANPTRLQVYTSSLNIQDCQFNRSATAGMTFVPPLRIHGTLSATTPRLIHNTFEGYDGQSAPLADLTSTVQRLERNQFLDLYNTALIQTQSVVHMNQEARNHTYSNPEWDETDPLWIMEAGDLTLDCGRNNFVHPVASVTLPIISYVNPTVLRGPVEWQENYWGYSCTNGIPESDLVNLDMLPYWAVPVDSYSECVLVNAPNNVVCGHEGITAYQLLKDGISAELAGDLDAARGNYFYLLALYPDSKETTEATLLLKALGLHHEYGLEHSADIHGDLLAVADSAETANQHGLAVLQVSSAWGVEALYGDRPAAVSALNAAYAAETDTKCRETIALALAEIATYPAQGGQSTSGPEVRYAQALVQQQAVQALLDFQRGSTLVAGDSENTPLPTSFAINRVSPNPFNPVTTLELALPRDGHLNLRVYNLLGQEVATLVDGRQNGGMTRVAFDGSALSTGMYLAVADFEGHTRVHKMLLVK